jgi:hypothetical protein
LDRGLLKAFNIFFETVLHDLLFFFNDLADCHLFVKVMSLIVKSRLSDLGLQELLLFVEMLQVRILWPILIKL